MISLLEYTSRLDSWVKTQPDGFRGSKEWDGFASDLRRLADKKKGVAEADALIKQGLLIVEWISKNKLSSAASAAWTPLRGELGKVALAYEVNNRDLPVQ